MGVRLSTKEGHQATNRQQTDQYYLHNYQYHYK